MWLKQGSSEATFICTICRTGDLDCSNKGWNAVEQHVQNEKHKNNLNALKNNSQLTFSISTTSSTSSTHTIKLVDPNKPLLFNDQVSQAEILWALKSVQNAFSYKNSDDVGELFRTVCGLKNCSEIFGSTFKNVLYIKNYERFVLCFDEQTNNQNKKQLDLYFRYWSSQKGLVVTRYYRTILLGHAQANVVVDGILGAFRTDCIGISKLLMLSRDNPNANKTVEKMINDAMKKVNAELLNVGTCNLHVIHNVFKAGTTETNWYVENFCMNIWSWFQKSPARQEDFENITNELNDAIEKTILYFSSKRWVLLGKVIDRVLKQYHMFREYFLVYLPSKQQKQIQSNSRYDNVKEVLMSNISKIRLNFILFLCQSIFDRFLTWFQKEEPLVHLLYNALCDLYRTVLLSFLSPEHVGSTYGGALLDIDFKLAEKQLTTKKLQIGEEARRLLVDVSASDRATFFHDVKSIYHAIADNLKKYLPLKNTFLKDLHVLDPASRTKQDSADTMIRVGRAIPKLLSNAEIDRIRYEFMMYVAETIDQSWYIKNKYHDSDDNNHTEYQQIDYYWNKTLSLTTSFGLPKYPTLSKIVKNILIISHGNLDAERGFSINEHIVTENRTLLSLSSINGLRSTWDAIKFYGVGSPHRISIKIDMIRAVQKSKSVYNQEQLSLKSLANREKEQSDKHEHTNGEMKKLIDRENQLLSKQKGLHDKQKKAQLLVDEGRQRLDNALKKADIIDAQAANALIGAGDEQVKLISDKLFKITDELLKIQSKRKNVLSHVQNKKQKMTATSE
ncbi:unnamed protein product [Rotaria socialis]|uniref:Uncharacterized protein n=1 Tax=Rotaria socialis TaxID=392032 RepID=A0A818MAY7_9BILA|nr:unnamed protein product [Rotaria socialis]CAF4872327.1 unnamed protein product [Rotaria socialis]